MEHDRLQDQKRARLFWNGRSQAVRLPKEFRFEGDEVVIRRQGESVVLEPVPRHKWPRGYWKWIDRKRDELELGEIEPVSLVLLDVSEELNGE